MNCKQIAGLLAAAEADGHQASPCGGPLANYWPVPGG